IYTQLGDSTQLDSSNHEVATRSRTFAVRSPGRRHAQPGGEGHGRTRAGGDSVQPGRVQRVGGADSEAEEEDLPCSYRRHLAGIDNSADL
uniref:Pecanex-like protein n=1 Tax=Macrostomum lignano TaxID=282301 RepID=A0A1I8GAL9_9PLAT